MSLRTLTKRGEILLYVSESIIHSLPERASEVQRLDPLPRVILLPVKLAQISSELCLLLVELSFLFCHKFNLLIPIS